MLRLFPLSFLLLFLAGCDAPSQDSSPPPARPATLEQARKDAAAEQAARLEASQREDCKSNIGAKSAEYKKLMSSRSYWPAALAIRRCSELLDDAQLKAMVATAEIKSYVQDIENTKLPTYDRARAAEALIREYPEEGKKYEKAQRTLEASAEQQQKTHAFKTRFERIPRIGSSAQEIISTGWGYPSSINKTTTANGTSEQWVYENGRYLYFRNGVLTLVQH